MSATFKDHDEQYFTYEDAKEVKERNGQYVVYGSNGSVLAAHPIESIEIFTTSSVPKNADS